MLCRGLMRCNTAALAAHPRCVAPAIPCSARRAIHSTAIAGIPYEGVSEGKAERIVRKHALQQLGKRCRSMLHSVAVCRSMLQRVATCWDRTQACDLAAPGDGQCAAPAHRALSAARPRHEACQLLQVHLVGTGDAALVSHYRKMQSAEHTLRPKFLADAIIMTHSRVERMLTVRRARNRKSSSRVRQ